MTQQIGKKVSISFKQLEASSERLKNFNDICCPVYVNMQSTECESIGMLLKTNHFQH